jgi:glycosyltransferase involved in cell wall biosynthesis
LDRKFKILYATDGLGNGGKERQLIETIKHINPDIFEIGVITFNPNQYYSKFVSEISDYYSVFVKEKSIIEPFLSVFEAFEKFKPDLVHSYDLLSSMYTNLPSKISKAIIVNASIQDSGLDKGWQYEIKRYLLSVSDINISNSLKGFTYYKTQGEVLYNFIDPERFKSIKNIESFNVVMVANFSVYKDYNSYFRIVKELINHNLIDKAFAVGSGLYQSKYQREIEQDQTLKNKVIFTGNINNVEEFLSSFSVGFLMSTEEYGEGISNSVLEYMASGVIPIVSDIGASSEIIDNGIDGFLVDKNDLSGIVEIISRIRTDESLRTKLIENAKSKIQERFNLKKNIENLENIYLKLLNN